MDSNPDRLTAAWVRRVGVVHSSFCNRSSLQFLRVEKACGAGSCLLLGHVRATSLQACRTFPADCLGGGFGQSPVNGLCARRFYSTWRHMERPYRSRWGSLLRLQLVVDLPGPRHSNPHRVGCDPSAVLGASTRNSNSHTGRTRASCFLYQGWLGSAFRPGSRFRAHGRTTPTGHLGPCGRDRDGGWLLAVSQVGYQLDTVDSWTISARVKTWRLGLQRATQSPLVGVGYGNDTFFKIHQVEVDADKGKDPAERVLPGLHNTFATVLMGSGVPALVLFIWMFVRIVYTLTRQWWQSKVAETQGLLAAVAVVTVGFATRNLFDYMFAGSLAHLVWILVATGIVLVSKGSEPHREIS